MKMKRMLFAGLLAAVLLWTSPAMADGPYKSYVWPDGLGFGMRYSNLNYLELSEDNKLGYRIREDDTVEIVSFTEGYDFDIPEEIDGRPVRALGIIESINRMANAPFTVTIPNSLTEISERAFEYVLHDGIELIVAEDHPAFVMRGGILYTRDGRKLILSNSDSEGPVADGTKEIGKNAFRKNCSLEIMELPEGLERIGENAFYDAEDLTEINIPDSVTAIDSHAFCHTMISEINLPDGLKTIGTGAFAFTEISSLRLPAGLSDLKGNPFYDCIELTHVTVPEGGRWRSENGVLYDDQENTLVAVWDEWGQETFTVPEGITRIAPYAFAGMKFSRIELPESIQEIGEGAFYESSLEAIRLPDSIRDLPASAFEWCENLTDVRLPDKLIRIGEAAFKNCSSLQSIDIPDCVEEIEFEAFSETALEEIDLPQSLSSIPNGCFYFAGQLESVHFPKGVKELGEYAFAGCDELKEIRLPDSLQAIGEGAFCMSENLSSVFIPDNVQSIGDYVFFDVDQEMKAIVGKGSFAEKYCTENEIPFEY